MRKKTNMFEECTSIGKELVTSFHAQFAQNQNHHQSLFLQVLTVLLTVLIGFGYLYVRVGINEEQAGIRVTPETIYGFLALAAALLSLSIALISNMALGFRRDQLVACNIRVKAGVMLSEKGEDENYFIGRFNPIKNTKFWNWMPEFHFIFFWALIVIKALLFFGLILNSEFGVELSCSFDAIVASTVVVVCISFIVDFIVFRHYQCKWKKYAAAAPERLR
ncbi:hypothetical protein [Arenicella xantha]|uniref:Uncharacterized protein n=1 Tax=Arenicella xantha TaxID=644221 RepID=A0A395JML9_9GAMM|nr:hypothetical protein [Arenicella xantha]RBP52904.1 hypothetical protein DFR28_101288 [Arenicella xantha]